MRRLPHRAALHARGPGPFGLRRASSMAHRVGPKFPFKTKGGFPVFSAYRDQLVHSLEQKGESRHPSSPIQ